MRILLTGAAGFVGSAVARLLLTRKDEVIGFDDFNDFYDPAIKRARTQELARLGTFSEVEGDLRIAGDVERAFGKHKFDVVCHLAARAGVRPSLEDPALYIDTNIKGTVHVLEAMHRRGLKKLVFASSSSVYGGNTKVPFGEDDPVIDPWSPYAASKRAAEQMLAVYHHLYGIESFALRFFTVYGPGQRPDLAIAKFVGLIARGEEVPFFGDGKSGRDYTFVDDIAAGVVAAIDRVKGCEIINLGGEKPVTLNEMLATIEKVLGKKAKLKRLPDQPGDVPITCADTRKARKLLGYKPSVTFEEGVRRYVESTRKT
ncbi:MAG: GDP-mannose 4,6-dehydratase [Planctomycetes bacterium]|nr:GDP-mannose 4,6-dehydratase [Planctomycetota bacterium]